MIISSNKELASFVKDKISKSVFKKCVIAERIGLSRQGLTNLLNKKSFSIDDANRVLNAIGINLKVEIIEYGKDV